MVAVERVLIRHESEAQLLGKALTGDAESVNSVIQFICSKDPDQRQAMQQTMHDLADANLCMHLTSCLATQRWDDHRDCDQRIDAQASEYIDEAIISFLTTDEYEWEGAIKNSVLHEALKHADGSMRMAAAVLLGMRGDAKMIPELDKVIDDGRMVWKLRAIRALGAINDARCAPALIKAITLDRGAYQTAAVRALRRLGVKAETAWQEALNHPNSHIRWHAAYGLGELGDARGSQLLAEALFDEDSNVRWASVEVLTRLGEQVLPAMLKALASHQNLGVGRQAIFQALKGAAFNSPEAQKRIKPLLECLHMPDTCHEAPGVARRILQA